MKDAYSFDRDEAGLDESFRKHSEAYKRIFERCGLEAYEVAAESRDMGGSGAEDFLAPSGSGENTLVTCENGDYAADLEIAGGRPAGDPTFPRSSPQPAGGRDARPADDRGRLASSSASTRGRPRRRCRSWPTASVVLALVRGDDRLNEMKLLAALGQTFRPAEPDEIREAFGADGGSIGPVGATVEVVADEALREGQYVVGREPRRLSTCAASRPAATSSRASPTCEKFARETHVPNCGGHLHLQAAIEVGHIFKLETHYSDPLDATFLDEDGTEQPLVMGSYGIGPGRVMAAAVEQSHDERRYRVADVRSRRTMFTWSRCPASRSRPTKRPGRSTRPGAEVLLDDRDAARRREVRRRRPDRDARCA